MMDFVAVEDLQRWLDAQITECRRIMAIWPNGQAARTAASMALAYGAMKDQFCGGDSNDDRGCLPNCG